MGERWKDITVFGSDYEEQTDVTMTPPAYRHRLVQEANGRLGLDQRGRLNMFAEWIPGRRPDSQPGAAIKAIIGSRENAEQGERRMTDRWDDHFMRLTLEHARMSKDPSTKVGAVIVGWDRAILSSGFNGFPRGIADTQERLADRGTKLELVVHAEMNAVLNAARNGTALRGCTLYLSATDASGLVWGGPPCTRCTVELIQAGIACIVSRPFKDAPSRWKDSIEKARALLTEAGVTYREVMPCT